MGGRDLTIWPVPCLRRVDHRGGRGKSVGLYEIAEEVIAHLSGLVGADVTVTLEIEASIPGGAPDQVVRTITENSRTLKFSSGAGFEKE